MKSFTTCSALAILAITSIGNAQGDPEIIQKIIEEGTTNNQSWNHLEYISYQIGPRLTGSGRLVEANAWTRDQFATWGLTNVHMFKWGELPVRFDRGPSYARMVEPMRRDFEFTAKSWSAGTNGVVRGIVLKAPTTDEEFSAIEDRLEGAWILSKGRSNARRGRRRGVVQTESIPTVEEKIGQQLIDAGIAGIIVPSNHERVNTRSLGGWSDIQKMDFDNLPKDVTIQIRRSDYDSLNSRLADGEEVVFEADLQHHFVEGPLPIYNTIAEIRGTEFPDEVVIVSGHLDSWDGPGSMGTQDNGTGSSMTLEAARILATVGAKPRRTIRFILWSGEEQGLLGSKGYLASLSEEERSKISAVFVDDGGTNYQGGLNCIESMAAILREAIAPVNEAFPDMTVEIHVNETMPQGGGSDHATFNRVGIPGFFWDEVGKGGREGKNYSFVWHTQNDTPRYAVPEYLVQASTCSAITAYNVAMADTLLPREVVDNGYTEQELATWSTVETPASGLWEAEIPYRDETYTMTLDFDISADGRVKGTSTSSFGGESKILRGTWDGRTKTINVTIRGNYGDAKLEANLSSDGHLMGSYSVGSRFKRDLDATRPEPEEAEEAESEEIAARSEATEEE